MKIRARYYERRSLLSVLDMIKLILAIGMFTISLIRSVVDLLKNDEKNNHP